jgi:hypothetical protein
MDFLYYNSILTATAGGAAAGILYPTFSGFSKLGEVFTYIPTYPGFLIVGAGLGAGLFMALPYTGAIGRTISDLGIPTIATMGGLSLAAFYLPVLHDLTLKTAKYINDTKNNTY